MFNRESCYNLKSSLIFDTFCCFLFAKKLSIVQYVEKRKHCHTSHLASKYNFSFQTGLERNWYYTLISVWVETIFFTSFSPWVKIDLLCTTFTHDKAGLKTKCSHTLKSYIISPEVKFHTPLRLRQNHLRVKLYLCVSNFRGAILLRGEISFVMVECE